MQYDDQNNENEDFESQFKGSPLGEVLGQLYQRTKEFYLEYVTSDYGHEMISQIPQSMAMAMVEGSPYRPLLTSYMLGCGHRDGEPARSLMNKGAVRITPTAHFRNVLRDAATRQEGKMPCGDEWWGDHGWLASWYESSADRFELWVYNHDGRYYLTRPRKET